MAKNAKLTTFNFSNSGNELKSYEKVYDGKKFEYHLDENCIFYCPDNKIIDLNRNVIVNLPPHQILVDCFIIDTKENTVSVYDKNIKDSFLKTVTDIEKITLQGDVITIIKKDEKVEKPEDRRIQIIVKDGRIIEFEDNSLTSCGDLYLGYCKGIKKLKMPKLRECEACFLNDNRILEYLYLPELEKCGIRFLYNNNSLKELYLPKLRLCGFEFITSNEVMIKADLPNLEKCGPYFMNSNNSLKILNTPKLNDIGYDFMSRYKGVIKSEIGKRVKLTTYLDSMDSNENRNAENGQWWTKG